MKYPTVTDNDNGEITVSFEGVELRWWCYASDAERRAKMLAAREYVEGWGDGKSSMDDVSACLQEMLALYPAFRAKPVGVPDSDARLEHERQLATEERARAVLIRAGHLS